MPTTVRKDGKLEASPVFMDDVICYVDEASSIVTYFGWAKGGTATSSALWKIAKLNSTTNPTTWLFADGNGNFDNIWDNRATTITYS